MLIPKLELGVDIEDGAEEGYLVRGIFFFGRAYIALSAEYAACAPSDLVKVRSSKQHTTGRMLATSRKFSRIVRDNQR